MLLKIKFNEKGCYIKYANRFYQEGRAFAIKPCLLSSRGIMIPAGILYDSPFSFVQNEQFKNESYRLTRNRDPDERKIGSQAENDRRKK